MRKCTSNVRAASDSQIDWPLLAPDDNSTEGAAPAAPRKLWRKRRSGEGFASIVRQLREDEAMRLLERREEAVGDADPNSPTS